MTRTAQVIMPKICHDRLPPSAKIDNTGRATEDARDLCRKISRSPLRRNPCFKMTYKDPNRRDPKSPFDRSSCDPSRTHNHTWATKTETQESVKSNETVKCNGRVPLTCRPAR